MGALTVITQVVLVVVVAWVWWQIWKMERDDPCLTWWRVEEDER